jgi:cytochrome P450
VLVIFIAGFDTTATALSFLMYYLGQNPDIQQRAREEIKTVLKGQKITSGDLRSLPYLTAVIKEGMRIQPPVGLIPTRAAETDVDYGGITFTKGTQVWLSVYGLHHNPELWPNPNRFDPDRFYIKSEENTKRHPFAYMPFSMKSRACLGNQFSLVEQTVFMCSLLSRFQWTSLELEPTSDPVISKPNRVVVDLKPITNQSSPSIL